jgi:hypothetical protein
MRYWFPAKRYGLSRSQKCARFVVRCDLLFVPLGQPQPRVRHMHQHGPRPIIARTRGQPHGSMLSIPVRFGQYRYVPKPECRVGETRSAWFRSADYQRASYPEDRT